MCIRDRDGGAYLTGSMGQTERAVILAWGGYRVPNLRVVGRCAYTNKVPATAFRSLARAQPTWGYESHQDNVARKLSMDPLEYRLKNLLKRGEMVMDGVSPMDADYAELFAETGAVGNFGDLNDIKYRTKSFLSDVGAEVRMQLFTFYRIPMRAFFQVAHPLNRNRERNWRVRDTRRRLGLSLIHISEPTRPY